MKPSTEKVREYLLRHGTITGKQAMRQLGIYRLSGRILELREMGMQIETEYRTQRGVRYGVYKYHSRGKAA